MHGGSAVPTALARLVRLVLAPNPGPMTLEGTCTWVLHGPAGAVVVDPGPQDAGHRAAVLDAVAHPPAGLPSALVQVLLTHSHHDHAAGAAELAAEAGAPLLPAGSLLDGRDPGGLGLQALATPGHTDDSVTLLLPAAAGGPAALLTGDTVLGRGSTAVAPDGLGAHLASLRALLALAAEAGSGAPVVLLPGHGPVRADAAEVVQELLAHRLERLEQVRAAVAAGARTPADVVAAVYPGLGPGLATAAERTAAASLALLRGA